MSRTTDSTHQGSTHTTFTEAKRCPSCRSKLVVWLAQMRRFDDSRDWYRCRECDEQFAIDRKSA